VRPHRACVSSTWPRHATASPGRTRDISTPFQGRPATRLRAYRTAPRPASPTRTRPHAAARSRRWSRTRGRTTARHHRGGRAVHRPREPSAGPGRRKPPPSDGRRSLYTTPSPAVGPVSWSGDAARHTNRRAHSTVADAPRPRPGEAKARALVVDRPHQPGPASDRASDAQLATCTAHPTLHRTRPGQRHRCRPRQVTRQNRSLSRSPAESRAQVPLRAKGRTQPVTAEHAAHRANALANVHSDVHGRANAPGPDLDLGPDTRQGRYQRPNDRTSLRYGTHPESDSGIEEREVHVIAPANGHTRCRRHCSIHRPCQRHRPPSRHSAEAPTGAPRRPFPEPATGITMLRKPGCLSGLVPVRQFVWDCPRRRIRGGGRVSTRR
jgi:hypothetical protein